MSREAKMGNMFGGGTEGGFFDIPVASAGDVAGARMVVMGVPIATSYQSVGAYCADAADTIRNAFGWPGVNQHYDFDMEGPMLEQSSNAVDWGNLACSETDFAENRLLIRSHVTNILNKGAVPIVIGGDDSVPIPVLESYKDHGPVSILQFDAHIDWRDEVQGEKMGLSSNMRRASEMPWVKNIVQVGARGIGSARPRDYQDARDWGVDFYPMKNVRSGGLQQVIDALPTGDVYVALDIDAMDPAVVPGVIGPAPGGLHYFEILQVLEALSLKSRIAGFSLVEFMPSADVGNRGALVSARIIASVMGLVDRQIRT